MIDLNAQVATRDGRPVRVLDTAYIIAEGREPLVLGVITEGGRDHIFFFDQSGANYEANGKPTLLDLVNVLPPVEAARKALTEAINAFVEVAKGDDSLKELIAQATELLEAATPVTLDPVAAPVQLP